MGRGKVVEGSSKYSNNGFTPRHQNRMRDTGDSGMNGGMNGGMDGGMEVCHCSKGFVSSKRGGMATAARHGRNLQGRVNLKE